MPSEIKFCFIIVPSAIKLSNLTVKNCSLRDNRIKRLIINNLLSQPYCLNTIVIPETKLGQLGENSRYAIMILLLAAILIHWSRNTQHKAAAHIERMLHDKWKKRSTCL